MSYGGIVRGQRENEDCNNSGRICRWISRSLSNKGYVLIRGKKAPILGRVCMDQFMVDVTQIEGVSFGDKVTMIGKDGNEILPVEVLSELSGRFNYEFVCDLGKRIPRVYVRDGKIAEQVDYFA